MFAALGTSAATQITPSRFANASTRPLLPQISPIILRNATSSPRYGGSLALLNIGDFLPHTALRLFMPSSPPKFRGRRRH